MSKFVITKNQNYQYSFRLKANNGETILSSELYTSNQSCRNGIESVKINAPYDSRYEKKTSVSGSPYFVLKAQNGQVIGVSEMYSSTYARDQGIESVKQNAPNASIEDLS